MNCSSLRTLLLLGRVSNLPTVWSNCLAAWFLCVQAGATGTSLFRLLATCVGVSLLYVGGMFLNDAFDVRFDFQYRPERPIPGGRIARRTVFLLSAGWLVSGLLVLAPMAGYWALALAGCILAYNAIHKKSPFGLPLMALCRGLIYPLAAAAFGFRGGALPWPLWGAALAMMGWVLVLSIGARAETKTLSLPVLFRPFLSFFAKGREGTGKDRKGVGASPNWALLPWVVPFWMLIFRTGETDSHLKAVPLIAWLARSTVLARWKKTGLTGAVPDLLAGIPLIDLLSVSPQSGLDSLPFLAFTALALFLRRNIPPS